MRLAGTTLTMDFEHPRGVARQIHVTPDGDLELDGMRIEPGLGAASLGQALQAFAREWALGRATVTQESGVPT